MRETSLKDAAQDWSMDNTVRMNETLSSHQAHCEAFEAGAKWALERAEKAVDSLGGPGFVTAFKKVLSGDTTS